MSLTRLIAFVAFACLALPGLAGATGIVETGDQIKIVNNTSSVHAGPFTIRDLSNPGVADFQSFCIEYSETILINGTYHAKLADIAVGGGRSRFDPVVGAGIGDPGTDPLSVGTAYLYRQFLDGTLAGYDYDQASRDGLQLAIWRLEGEVGVNLLGQYVLMHNHNGVLTTTVVPGSTIVPGAVAKANAFYLDASTGIKGTYASYDVRVMQLWTNPNLSSGARQDQLVSVRTATVPEPISTFSALLLGVSALGLARRRLGR